MDIRALLGRRGLPMTLPASPRGATQSREVKMKLLSTVITQGNAALPHFNARRLKTGWTPNREQATVIYESLVERLARAERDSSDSRLGYYRGGYYHREAKEVHLKDEEVAVSLANTTEKLPAGLLEIPRGMMDESFASSTGSDHYLPRLLSPRTAIRLTPKSSPKQRFSHLQSSPPQTHNKTISRLLDSVSPDLKAQLERSQLLPAAPHSTEVRIGRTAGNKSLKQRTRKTHSRTLSSGIPKPQRTSRMRVTGTPWVYCGVPCEEKAPRPKTAAAKHTFTTLELPHSSNSALVHHRRTSTGTELDAIIDTFSPQLLKPRYQMRNATPKRDSRIIDVKLPTPKLRAATVLVTHESEQSAHEDSSHHRATTILSQPLISEWSVRITPKVDDKSKVDKSTGSSDWMLPVVIMPEARPNISSDLRRSVDPSGKSSVGRTTPESVLHPKITSSKCVSADSKGSTPTPSLQSESEKEKLANSELSASLAVTVLKPRLSNEVAKECRGRQRGESGLSQSFYVSYQHPEVHHFFFEETASPPGIRPKSGAVRKGRAKLEAGNYKGRQVRCVRVSN